MSDAAAELNFPAGEDADAVMLGVLGQDVETASGVSPGTYKWRVSATGVGEAVSSRFTRLRAVLSDGLAAIAGADRQSKGRSPEGIEPALAADDQDSAVSSPKPMWRRADVLGGASAIALGVVLMGAVAFWPDGKDGSSAAPVSETGLMAPAAKLATALRRDPAPAVVERPAVAPTQQLINEVESLWESGARSKDREKASDATSGTVSGVGAPKETAAVVAPTVSEVGLATSAGEPAKSPAVGEAAVGPANQTVAAVAAHDTEASAKKKLEDGPRVASVVKDATIKGDDAKAAPVDETKLYSMITEVSTLVRRTREEVAKIAGEHQKSTKAVEAKLADFERRLNLGEAQGALNAAKATSTTPPELSPTNSPTSASPSPASGAQKGVITASLSTEAPSAPPAARYRVQAASPGLAMLSEIDRSGDDVLPLQVAVGANVPGYGRVTKISQRGSEWVVQTEKGSIR
ncbi:MAG: hypothetical protein WBO09_06130 [Methylocystis silviterrae]|uniref:hypothetical protein n=1 Tax=Methylocystis silviterrae TaxID=2743612 RepID=UPI003C76C131